MEGDSTAQGVLDAEQAFLNAMRDSEQQEEKQSGERKADGQRIKEENEEIEDFAKVAPSSDNQGDDFATGYTPASKNSGPAASGATPPSFQSENVQENAYTEGAEDQYDPSRASGDITTSVVVQEPTGEAVGTNDSHLRESNTIHVPPQKTTDTPSAPTPSLPDSRSVLVNPGNSNTPHGQTVNSTQHSSHKRKRLPQDIVGQLEDRISEDPRGDIEAWLALISEHQKKGKFDDAREAYERFLTVWPTAASQWIAYARMELSNNELRRVEQIFGRCLLSVLNVDLWSLYLDYIRRINNLATDTAGNSRATIAQAYEFALSNIGIDKDSGKIWQDYVAFIKSGPGTIGGSGWQDQQKMDHLRKVYQKVICLPVQGVNALWQEYDAFEMGLNKVTGRKFLQERSPASMTARASLHELSGLTAELDRHRIARLSPLPGFDGYEDYQKQISIWKRWIEWEKSDPLVLGKEDPEALRNRIIYAYKQAMMALQFEPQIWFEAAEYLSSQELHEQAMETLKSGMAANPESCLLHFKYAERLEATIPNGDSPETIHQKSQLIRKPYEDLLGVLYGTAAKLQAREKEEITKIEQAGRYGDFDNDDESSASGAEARINAIKEGMKVQQLALSKTISSVWINLMRAMRRTEGHGKVGDLIGGSRQVFADARRRGKITSDVYVASALIEYHCYKDPAATRIFERGMKLFPEDEDFALEYLKHLIAINDITNARAVFETFVGKVSPEKARKVFHFFHGHESHYGELGQVYKLEKRMAELYPDDPYIKRFERRYAYASINPCSYTPVVSMQQVKPKAFAPPPPIEQAAPAPASPRLPVRTIASPKRSAEESGASDADNAGRPRKIHRPDSPLLKGAAGRRLQRERGRVYASSTAPVVPTLPDGVMFLLGILPGADKYHATRFNPEAIVNLLRNVELPDSPPQYKR